MRYFCVENSVKQLIAVVTSQQTYSYSQHSHMPFTHPSSNRSVQMFCISSHKIAINFLFGLKISVCVMRQWRNSSIETQWHVLYPLRLACERSFFFSLKKGSYKNVDQIYYGIYSKRKIWHHLHSFWLLLFFRFWYFILSRIIMERTLAKPTQPGHNKNSLHA